MDEDEVRAPDPVVAVGATVGGVVGLFGGVAAVGALESAAPGISNVPGVDKLAEHTLQAAVEAGAAGGAYVAAKGFEAAVRGMSNVIHEMTEEEREDYESRRLPGEPPPWHLQW